MRNLRLLDVYHHFTSCEPTFLPDELRWLCWFQYPFPSLPLTNMHKLVGLQLRYGRIEHLWEGQMVMRNLKFINFYDLSFLKRLPDISGAPNIERRLRRLCLHDCCGLQKLPEDFGTMDKLEELQLGSSDYFSPFEGQVETINFHVLTNLSSLTILDLAWRQIGDEDFPKDLHGLCSLEELNISHNSKLTQLPASISHLSRLKHLELDECIRLQVLHALPSGLQVLKASRCKSLEKIEDLSNAHENLYMIWLLDCQKLLSKQESRRYLDMMLNETFLKKWAALDHGLSISIPGSKIPSWFKEQDGNEIALKLHPNWQSQILGFAICGVFKQPTDHPYHNIKFRYERDAICDPKQRGDYDNAPTTTFANENVWIGYIPFSCFVQMHHNKHLLHDDWSNIIEGNLVVTVGLSYHKS
ncbi:hypothetical protein M8C21_019962, partial [Ambrosia artemisiifolia]